MTSENLFFKLAKEDLKHRVWAAALAFLGFFFTLPVGIALLLSTHDRTDASERILAMQKSSARWLSIPENIPLAVLVVGLALILGVSGFAYLHSKQKVDFYHSIPVPRKTLFFVNYAVGILIPAAAYFINLCLAILVAAVMGGLGSGTAAAAFTAYGFFMLHYILIYSFVVLAMVLTGNVIVGILGSAIFFIYVPTLCFILEMLYQQFFYNAYTGGSDFLANILTKSSPLAYLIWNIGKWNSFLAGEKAVCLVAAAVVSVLVTALSYILYKKRGSEAAGKAMAFTASQPVIRIPLVSLCGLLGAMLFWAFRSSIAWTVFGLLCGAVVSHGIIEIIYHFDFKKLFGHKASLAASMVIAAAIFGIFRYDAFGYDSYLPRADHLESAAVYFNSASSWVDHVEYKVDENGNASYTEKSIEDYVYSHMKIKDTADVLALAEEGIKQSKGERPDGKVEYITVCYRLKNGRKVLRSYHVSGEKAWKYMMAIYELPQFKEGLYPLLAETGEDMKKVRITQNEQSREIDGAQTDISELLAAYQREFKGITEEVLKRESPIAVIQFIGTGQDQAERQLISKYGKNSWRYLNMKDYGTYPIYPSFTETKALLGQCGIGFEERIQGQEIERIEIDPFRFVDDDYYVENKEDILVTDPGEIGEIMDHVSYGEYYYMNPYARMEYSFPITVVSKDWKTQIYRLNIDEVPEFLKERIRTAAGGFQTVFD